MPDLLSILRQLTIVALCCSAVAAPGRPVVALLTDFGQANEAVGQCHGEILKVNSDIQIIDLCHAVDSYDIQLAALMLRGAASFPRETVFVVVVDPGVGTKREAIALRTAQGQVYIGPNNGVLTYVAKEQGIKEIVLIDPKTVNPTWEPGTFDGRDLFSPAGAQVANGKPLVKLGKPLSPEKLVRLEVSAAKVDPVTNQIEGTFLRTDEPYGNLWTNITKDDLISAGIKLGDQLTVHFDKTTTSMPFVVSFGHVAQGQMLAYLNSSGTLAFAINQGNFVQSNKLERGAAIRVRKSEDLANN